MGSSTPLDMTLLPGARALLAAHARELPQRDDLCGAFCGALALRAAGIDTRGGGPLEQGGGPLVQGGAPLDQDAVAIAAGSTVSAVADVGHLPHGERGRRDYRLRIPFVESPAVSGTTAGGLRDAVEELSAGGLAAIPYSGPWNAATLAGLFDVLAALERPVALLANLATHHLWGGHPRAEELLAYLLDGDGAGPPADWEVGHFVCVVGRLRGPGGSLYMVADTYPALGDGGVHLQPQERLAAAIARTDMPAGGGIVVSFAQDASAVRRAADGLGLVEEIWDNGTAARGGAMRCADRPTRPARGVRL